MTTAEIKALLSLLIDLQRLDPGIPASVLAMLRYRYDRLTANRDPATKPANPTAADFDPLPTPSADPAQRLLALACATTLMSIPWESLMPSIYNATTHNCCTERLYHRLRHLLVVGTYHHAFTGNCLAKPTAPRAPLAWSHEANHLSSAGLRRPTFTENLWYLPGQYPHHDPADPRLVRYRPLNRNTCALDAFISAKPGKFLAAHYSDKLTPDEIAAFAAKFRADGEPQPLMLARTESEIRRVYLRGPTSCMSGTRKKIDNLHPVSAYAAPDLAVAYLQREKRYTARCLVRLSNKTYSRIYGDAIALIPILESNGYRPAMRTGFSQQTPIADAFEGVALRALHSTLYRPADAHLEASGEPVCIVPYFDGPRSAYYDPPTDSLIVTTKTPPKGRTLHRLVGGTSLYAVKHGPLESVPTATYPPNQYMKVYCGDSGRLITSVESLASLHRTEEELDTYRPPVPPLHAATGTPPPATIQQLPMIAP